MAKPDLDDGWTPLAHELLASILCAKIPHEARVVLSLVLLQAYGPAKRKEVELDAPTIARQTGLKRPNVWRGISFLADSGLLERVPGGLYRFVKDHARWRDGGEPLLTPQLASLAVFAPALAMSYRTAPPTPQSGNLASQNATEAAPVERIQIDTASEVSGGSSVSDSIRAEYQNGYANRISPDTRIPNRETNKDTHTHTGEGGASESVSGSKPEATPFGPIGPNTAEEVGQAYAVLATHYPADGNMATWVRMWLREHKVARVVGALIKAAGKNQPSSYAQSILNRPDDPRPEPTRNGPAAPPRSRTAENRAAVARIKERNANREDNP